MNTWERALPLCGKSSCVQVWCTIKEEDGHGSLPNVKYFRGAGQRYREARGGGRGGGTESEKNEEGYGSRTIWNPVLLILMWLSLHIHVMALPLCMCVCVHAVIIHITYHFHFNCTWPREGGPISITLIIHKSKYSRFYKSFAPTLPPERVVRTCLCV